MNKNRNFLKKIYFYCICGVLTSLSIAAMLIFLNACGLPDPYSFTPNTPPDITGIWNGAAIEITISGPFTQKNYPNLQGFNFYFADNNDPKEISKRVLFLDDEENLPSVEIFWRNFNAGTTFTKTITLPTSFNFKLTDDAENIDMQEEQVTSKETLLKNKIRWKVEPFKKFYFNASAIINEKESFHSSTLLIEIPKITEASANFGKNYVFSGEAGPPSLNFRFEKSTTLQKLYFGFTTTGTTDLTQISATTSVEVYNYGVQSNWKTAQRPTIGYTTSPESYGEGFLFFFRRLENGTPVSNIQLYINSITSSSVSFTIWEFK